MVSLLAGPRNYAEFVRREDGAGTVLNLMFLVSLIAVGGLAVDVTNVTTSRTELQITADAVAHAALLSRETMDAENAKLVALALSDENLPIEDVGEVITDEDIVFGYWNETTNTFTADEDSRSGVQVTARQNSEGDNPIATTMLKIVGFDEWDVSVTATFMT
jgi:Flp pilus assembly protein TadG